VSEPAIFNPARETMSREQIEQLQLERLQATVNRVYRNVAFYGRRFEQLDLAPEDVASLADLVRLPLTTKQDLRDSYPYGMFALPLREVVRVHCSSGTTGQRTVVGYTKNDLADWAEAVARNLAAAGVTKDEVVQIFFGYGLFSGGFGFHAGAEALGASVIPMSSADIAQQIEIMHDFRTTVLCGTPSYALQMAEALEERGINPNELHLRIGVFGAEPWSEQTRQEIEKRLFLQAFDVYGLSEMGGPGVAAECRERCGLHITEDFFLPEIVAPDTGEPLPDGREGELVLTTLSKEAFPLLRYRTGDLTSLDRTPCACGRTTARMARVQRRTDDVIFIRGSNVSPHDIEAVLKQIEEVGPRYRIVVERRGALDVLEVQVEMRELPDLGTITNLERLEADLAERLRAAAGMRVEVRLLEPRSLAEVQDSDSQVIDRRRL